MIRMRRRPRVPILLALLVVALAAPARADETLVYKWRLRGWLGSLASMFMPSNGDGTLYRQTGDGGLERSELVITSRQSGAEEFFRYGSEWYPESGRVVRAWSSSSWRGENRSKEDEIDSTEVVDIVSAISLLRRAQPRVARRLEIWSDGRLYPVLVVPRRSEPREVAGRQVQARQYSVLGVEEPGRRVWKGRLDLWIAADPQATPVEIVVARRGVKVLLILAEPVAETPAADLGADSRATGEGRTGHPVARRGGDGDAQLD